MKLSIIYVNYNTTELLRESIKSLANLPAALSYEVIVVDNASKNFDPHDVLALVSSAKVIMNHDNLGFGKANNIGAEAAAGEYLWILNTDTLVPENNHLDRLVDFLDAETQYAAALPLLKDGEGVIQPTQVAYFPTPSHILLNIPVRILAKILPGLKDLYSKVNLDYASAQTRDVEVAVCAALFIRREVFDEVKGFSPEYFFFFEDSDLCAKIWRAGYKIRFFTEAHMTHLWGRSIAGRGAFLRRKLLYFQSQDIYLRKWHTAAGRCAVQLLRLPLLLRYYLFNH